jgi:hypothetical protein
MTYTFKLARRLAVSRTFFMLPVFLVLAACSGSDATAPQDALADLPESGIYGWRPRESTPVAVYINPSNVTVETNQLIQFNARGRNRAGDDIVAPVSWSTTGGTILPDGRFSAAAIGTYRVMGRTRTRDDVVVVDTSIVTVVRRQLGLGIVVTPDTVTLTPRASQLFSAVGQLRSGGRTPVGVYWTATGGSIDDGGNYLAGDTAGTFLVIATNTSGTVADTSTVTITAPPALPPPSDSVAPPTIPVTPTPPPEPPPAEPTPPPAEPTPPPAPVLAKVILKPWSVTLATNTQTQFAAFGRTATGDSMAINVTFSATGGTVTPTGLYTAGGTPGGFRVIATAEGLADTSGVTVTVPLGSATVGIPFGSFATWVGSSVKPNASAFNLSVDATNADHIISRISAARTQGVRLILAMTGGAHDNYLTNGVFDKTKWLAKMKTFDTPAIKAAVAAGVADGTILGNSVMDEPNHYTWGPTGTMTKAEVDEMAAYVKAMFPTLAQGVSQKHNSFEPTKSYQVIDFINDQYELRQGDVVAFRDAGLALARRDGHAVIFSINLLDGGTIVPGCPVPETGGTGTFSNRCRVTPAQLEAWATILGPAGCAMTMWRYDDAFMSVADNQRAFRNIAALLAPLPRKPCRRS